MYTYKLQDEKPICSEKLKRLYDSVGWWPEKKNRYSKMLKTV